MEEVIYNNEFLAFNFLGSTGYMIYLPFWMATTGHNGHFGLDPHPKQAPIKRASRVRVCILCLEFLNVASLAGLSSSTMWCVGSNFFLGFYFSFLDWFSKEESQGLHIVLLGNPHRRWFPGFYLCIKKKNDPFCLSLLPISRWRCAPMLLAYNSPKPHFFNLTVWFIWIKGVFGCGDAHI